jgi:tetratricopeptide (TPR) repeat protein
MANRRRFLRRHEEKVIVRRETVRITGVVGAIVALALGMGSGACGGSSHVAKTPAPQQAHAVAPVPPPVTVQGQQVGLTAGPSADSDLSGSAKDAYSRGFQAWVSGDLKAARDAFSDAAGKSPSAGGPRYSLGCVLERMGDIQGAQDAYRAAYSVNPKYEVAIGAYALLLARTGHGTDAEQFLSGKRSQNPDSVRLTSYLAEVKSIEGDSPGCQLLAQQALAKQPDFKDAMVVIARDYYRSHRWDLARYALQAVLDGADDGSIPPRDKGNPEALLLRALVERDTGQRKQAIVDFGGAIAKRPDLFEAYINLGEMKLEAGNATEAQAPLEKAVRYAPNIPIAHLDLGDCYRLLGRPGDAKKEFDTALGMDSTLAGAHYNLGLLYLFSTSVPGVSSADDQLAKAIKELETYKSMRGAKVPKGQGDDVDELLSTAKRKQNELQIKKQAAATAAAAPPPTPAASAAPAGSAGTRSAAAVPATSAIRVVPVAPGGPSSSARPAASAAPSAAPVASAARSAAPAASAAPSAAHTASAAPSAPPAPPKGVIVRELPK